MQSQSLGNNRRIAKNTTYLYVRMFVTMAVALYTSRIVLKVLGSSDFGLYNVIGGILSMFAMFSAALTVGTQRFLTFAIGEGNFNKLKKTFSLALGLHVCLSLLVLLLCETLGIWFIVNNLNIPSGREYAALWVWQFTIFGFMVNLVQVPFQSSLIAHEDMNMYAYMSIYDAAIKLLTVLLIPYINYDRLILYAGLTFSANLSSVLIYNHYCRKHYSECTFSIKWDKQIFKEFAVYSGWNVLGGSLSFFTNQGINILLNIFCGTIVNAARSLSIIVNQYVVNFVTNFQTAVNPQIVKLWAAHERDSLFRLVVNNGRIAEYLFLFIAIPAFIEIDFLLNLWLGEYPKYTDIFIQIILIQSAINVAEYPIGMLIHAIGKMAMPSLVSLVLILIFPISYVILKMGYSPVTVYIASTLIWPAQNISDLYWAHKYSGIPVLLVLKNIYINTIIGGGLMFIVPFIISQFMEEGWARFLLVVGTSAIWSCVIIYTLGMTPGMRTLVLEKLHIKKN